MINTWVRPKEWPASSTPTQSLPTNSPMPVQKPIVSTTDPTRSSSQPPQPPASSSNGSNNESESGAKKFQMKISGSSTISKSGLPGT